MMPSASRSAEWLIFIIMVLVVGLAVAIVTIWAVVARPKGKKRHRKHRRRHTQQHNPTLAQTGGLPPLRDPNQPPPGP